MGEEERKDEGVSRRTVIKRIGAGAAIAWTAPVLTSLRTPAFAQTYGGGCSQCAGDFCLGQTLCQADLNDCFGGLCGCAQVVGNESSCFCYCNDLCSNRTPCSQQSDCSGGQVCVHSCCDAFLGTPACFDPCPNPAPSGQRVTARRIAKGSGRSGLG
jgi:hypothetical protein